MGTISTSKMAADFSVEAVKACNLERGGRIRNHELVTYFKNFLNHPIDKAVNREKFKDFVNELATIKVEEGEKILVLKRKHRAESIASSQSSAIRSPASPDHPSPPKAPYQPPYEPSTPRTHQGSNPYQPSHLREPVLADAMRARSEPPSMTDMSPRVGDRVDSNAMSRTQSDNSFDAQMKGSSDQSMGSASPQSPQLPGASSSQSLASGDSQMSLSSAAETVSGSGEEDGNMSVLSIKERVQHLNRMSSESDVQQTRTPRVKKGLKDRDDDDESHTSGGTSYVTLTPEEKEWMLTSATADYHEMHRLLTKNARLAKVKDIANGYTALHWAAKFGKPEVVKMLANKIGVNVNQRSLGGYTPLHLAAIHGHEDIIELLVSVYKADANLRDYSGKKAKQYLKNSASSRAQQLLISTKLRPNFGSSSASMDDSFSRSLSTRQSNRARALSSLFQATSSVMRQPVLRSSWEGGVNREGGERTPGSTPPGSASASPIPSRRHQREDRCLMPPPHLAAHRRRRGDRSTSSSRESLNSQTQSTSAMGKENNNNQTVPRSESDPALARKTFV